ncbi:flagellar hook-length control protein FliK [Rubellimicrobium aerolatum]|uniref:Flagellar hook-length control protein FliK n=1 Tax=Rubellimicrobium aerolatum TaxID=490979 RepID=A0ABW0S9V0_9RHOB|nr:flagellar hook-length control protein FliK [Rubellimicrobium aerolatum]MBP1805057.1 flagellar hook-length control protein FliK [Rubellimicrobium aerolatum]
MAGAIAAGWPPVGPVGPAAPRARADGEGRSPPGDDGFAGLVDGGGPRPEEAARAGEADGAESPPEATEDGERDRTEDAAAVATAVVPVIPAPPPRTEAGVPAPEGGLGVGEGPWPAVPFPLPPKGEVAGPPGEAGLGGAEAGEAEAPVAEAAEQAGPGTGVASRAGQAAGAGADAARARLAWTAVSDPGEEAAAKPASAGEASPGDLGDPASPSPAPARSPEAAPSVPTRARAGESAGLPERGSEARSAARRQEGTDEPAPVRAGPPVAAEPVEAAREARARGGGSASPGRTRAEDRGTAEGGAAPTGSFAALATTAPGPEGAATARSVARQIAAQPALRTGGAAEVSLAPKELGELRLSVEVVGDGLRVHIEAARPDTADLMRRHVEALRQELRQEGLGGVSVSIGGGDSQRESTSQGRSQGADRPGYAAVGSAGTALAESLPVAARPRAAPGHIDLRF